MTNQFPGATKMVLSPAAQAVFHAFNSKFDWVEDGVPGPQFNAIAAALRTAADQVVPESCFESDDITAIRNALLAVAAELEAQ
jgi:hypothetical protein